MTIDPFRAPGPHLGNNANTSTARVTVMNSGGISKAQMMEIKQCFERHKNQLAVSLGGYLVNDRSLSDGTRIRIVTNSGMHQVLVWPKDAGGKAYELLPAFYMDAPEFGDHPDPVNSATWKTMPYAPDATLQLVNSFWREHPGNQTWYDAREDSPNKGLVLSWWGLSKDRYGASWANHLDSDEVSPTGSYADLFCNGTKIGTLPGAIYGACITEVDGVAKIAALTSGTFTEDEPSYRHTRYTSAAGYSELDAFTSIARHSLNLFLVHATMPVSFRGFALSELTFDTITLIELDDFATTFDIEGDPHWFRDQPMFRATEGAKFNMSGTEGVIRVYFGDVAPFGTSDFTGFIHYLRIDPRDGSMSADLTDGTDPEVHAAVTAAWPTPYAPPSISWNYIWFDYIEDELTRIDLGVVPLTETEALFYVSTEHWGVMGSTESYLQPVAVGEQPNRWITGDIRAGLINATVAWEIKLRVLKNDTLEAGAYAIPSGYNTINHMSVGWEGCDSSFDRRLVVDRADGDVYVFVDDEDVTATFEAFPDFNLQDVKYPVLCGPLLLLTGSPVPPLQYVSGEAP